RALAFDDGVGGERGAVNDDADVGWLEPCLREDLLDAAPHPLLGCARRGQHLDAVALLASLNGKIREGAADIDGETSLGHALRCRCLDVATEIRLADACIGPTPGRRSFHEFLSLLH